MEPCSKKAVEYPIGHRRRRADGIPLLEAKFRKNLASGAFLPGKQQHQIPGGVAGAGDAGSDMPVHEYVDLYVI